MWCPGSKTPKNSNIGAFRGVARHIGRRRATSHKHRTINSHKFHDVARFFHPVRHRESKFFWPDSRALRQTIARALWLVGNNYRTPRHRTRHARHPQDIARVQQRLTSSCVPHTGVLRCSHGICSYQGSTMRVVHMSECQTAGRQFQFLRSAVLTSELTPF